MTIDEKRDMVDELGDGVEEVQPESLEELAEAALGEDTPEGAEALEEAETTEAADAYELEAADDADEFWFDEIEDTEKAALPEETEAYAESEVPELEDADASEPEATEALEPEIASEEPEAAEAEELIEEAKAEETPEESADKNAPEPQSAAAAIGFKPTESQVKEELLKERQRTTFFQILRRTVFSLVVVAAVAVIVATLILPILQISGTSMTETLQDQDIVAALRGSDCETGDVIAFYYNNKILVKRVIATSGQWVDIDKDGNVYVDNVLIDEPYVSDKALGECNIKLPYQVPEGRIFVMGDHRSVSVDSRSTTVGCIADEQIVGKLLMCVWPLDRFGLVN